MRIRIASDTHWEHTFKAQHRTRAAHMPYPEFWVPPELPDDKDTVMILAGDLYNGLRSIPIIQGFHNRFKAVLITLGNHDYYGENFHTLADEYKAELIFQEMENVYLLDRDCIKIGDVLFVGATLWTDMNQHDPLTILSAPSYMTPDFGLIHEGANYDDHYIIRNQKLQAKTWLNKNEKDFQYIKTVVENNTFENICVVTHHGCTFEAVDPRFKDDSIGNGYFFSEYSEFIASHDNIVAWVHGHTHSQVDLTIGECKVIANPFGYPGEHQQFDEYLTIEI